MTTKDRNENGWSLEDDTEIRRTLLEDDSFANLLPEQTIPPESPRRRSWILKILLLTVLIGASFVLGVLYSQNTQLKDESTKLVDEKETLNGKITVLGNVVGQCREELNLCAEDVDLLQELSEYDLNPKERYGEGYDDLRKLQAKRGELGDRQQQLQADIENTVNNLWRPSKQSKQFWIEFKRTIREKKKIERNLKRLDKKYQQVLAEMDRALFERKVQLKEKIKTKNDNRRQLATSLESVPAGSKVREPHRGDAPNRGKQDRDTPSKPKENLASVVP